MGLRRTVVPASVTAGPGRGRRTTAFAASLTPDRARSASELSDGELSGIDQTPKIARCNSPANNPNAPPWKNSNHSSCLIAERSISTKSDGAISFI